MNPFEKIPLLRFFIPLLCGVFVSLHYDLNIFFISSLYLISILLFIVEKIFYKIDSEKKQYRYRWLGGIFLSLALLFSGMLLVKNNDLQKLPGHFSHYNYKANYVVTQLEENISERKNTYRALMKVVAIKEGNTWYKTKGKIIQYFQKDSSVKELSYGDCILQKAFFTPVATPQNPHEFNYSRYLANDGIYHQSYLKVNDWKLIAKDKGNPLLKIAFEFKSYILKKLKDTGISEDGFALISALLLGMSDNLDADILKSFSASGTTHVLCVSGLHVGIFFLLLNYILAFLDKKSYGRIIKAVLIILSIWFYALVTGLAPSVLRASIMFSIIVIAKQINRHSSIYNTLLFSAILLIIIDPYIVTKLGFWLSYMAVVGIVYLFPQFYELLKFKNKFIEKIWALACVSLAAQIATSPLSIYYFNQFPNYFLISNIIVVPLVTIIVYMSVGLLFLSFVPFLSSIVVYVLSFLLNVLQFIVSFIEGLPYSTSIVVINQAQLIFLYVFILLLILYFKKIKTIFLKLAFLCLVIIFALNAYQKQKNMCEQKLTLYSIDRYFALELKTGNDAVFIADSSLFKKQQLLSYHVKTNQLKSGIKNITEIPLEKLEQYDSLYNLNTYLLKNYICFGNKKFVIINDKKYYTVEDNKSNDISKNNYSYKSDCMGVKAFLKEHLHNNYLNSSHIKFATDFIILSKLKKGNRETLLSIFKTNFVIFSTTLKKNEKELLYKQYAALIKDFWDLKIDGALTLKIAP